MYKNYGITNYGYDRTKRKNTRVMEKQNLAESSFFKTNYENRGDIAISRNQGFCPKSHYNKMNTGRSSSSMKRDLVGVDYWYHYCLVGRK